MACLTRILAQSLDGKSLHEHFGVHGKYELRRINLNTFHLDVCHKKNFVYTFRGIPEDIEKLISSYLHKHFVCTLEIHYEDVFRPPIFKIIQYDSNLYINMEGLICVLHVLSRGVPAPKGQQDPTVGRASSAWQASTRV